MQSRHVYMHDIHSVGGQHQRLTTPADMDALQTGVWTDESLASVRRSLFKSCNKQLHFILYF